ERATEIFKWINFAIVAGLIVWVFGKLLPPVFRKKAEAISSAIRIATNAKAAADAQLREAETRLANLEKEVAELRAYAEKEGAAEPAGKQLHDFGAAYAQSAELRTFLLSPAVSPEAKHTVIEKIVARLGASKIIRNFLFVLADHRRTQLIPEVIAAFHQVIRQRQGAAEAEVSSAVELSEAQKKEIAAMLV